MKEYQGTSLSSRIHRARGAPPGLSQDCSRRLWALSSATVEYLLKEWSEDDSGVLTRLVGPVPFNAIYNTRPQPYVWTVRNYEATVQYAFHPGDPPIWAADSEAAEEFSALLQRRREDSFV
jgi:hypothetical protein